MKKLSTLLLSLACVLTCNACFFTKSTTDSSSEYSSQSYSQESSSEYSSSDTVQNSSSISVCEHEYQNRVTQAPTCTAKGIRTFTCTYCQASYTESFTSYTPTEIFQYVENSVAEILTYDKDGTEYALGSGFVYSADGKIVTNYHVLEDSYSAIVTVNGRAYNVEKVLAYDKTIDVAVLKINASDLPVVPVCDGNVQTGSSVYAIGSSRGLTATISNGIITHAAREMDGVTYVQHNAAISAGNSGGPLVNEYGEIIGINTFTVTNSQNLNFAIFVSELNHLSYATPLTMAQFYEKECDVFEKMKNYIVANGTYDAEDNEYSLELGRSYSSDYSSTYIRTAYYDVTDNTIQLSLFIYGGDNDMILIYIDEIDGVYDWAYGDKYNNFMTGTIYASTFTSDSLLGYSYNNITSSSLRTAVRELASTMVKMLERYFDSDFASIGVTITDLGFPDY